MTEGLLEAIAGLMIIAGSGAIFYSRRTSGKRLGSRSHFICSWASVSIWFGTTPLVDGLNSRSSPAVQDGWTAIVVVVGAAATLSFAIAGIRSRRTELKAEPGASKYFWSPWAVFGWTLGLGSLAIFAGGLLVASAIGVFYRDAPAVRVEMASQNISSTMVLSLYVLLFGSILAGLLRWQKVRSEQSVIDDSDASICTN